MEVHARTREQNGSEYERQWGDAVRGGMGGGTPGGVGVGIGEDGVWVWFGDGVWV